MEKHLYDDLIIANFVDSYNNLTLKTMASLEWIDSYCNQSEYVRTFIHMHIFHICIIVGFNFKHINDFIQVLKTDDDMFINVPNLLTFIDKIEVRFI
jgi:hypothetical protein